MTFTKIFNDFLRVGTVRIPVGFITFTFIQIPYLLSTQSAMGYIIKLFGFFEFQTSLLQYVWCPYDPDGLWDWRWFLIFHFVSEIIIFIYKTFISLLFNVYAYNFIILLLKTRIIKILPVPYLPLSYCICIKY